MSLGLSIGTAPHGSTPLATSAAQTPSPIPGGGVMMKLPKPVHGPHVTPQSAQVASQNMSQTPTSASPTHPSSSFPMAQPGVPGIPGGFLGQNKMAFAVGAIAILGLGFFLFRARR